MTATSVVFSGPRPRVDDPDTKGFFTAAAQGRLVVCTCGRCQRVLHPPRGYCADCQVFDATWSTVSGSATLFTWTVIEHGIGGAFPVPYTVVIVALEELPEVRMVGSIPGRPDLKAGMAMRVHFEDLGDGVTLPQWRPVLDDD
jgi:uncharacterized protein